MIETPYLLFPGDAPGPRVAKVAQGIRDWRPEFAVDPFRHSDWRPVDALLGV